MYILFLCMRGLCTIVKVVGPSGCYLRTALPLAIITTIAFCSLCTAVSNEKHQEKEVDSAQQAIYATNNKKLEIEKENNLCKSQVIIQSARCSHQGTGVGYELWL